MDEKITKHRDVFDTVAELYDEVRETYPQELGDYVLSKFKDPKKIRILEIGTGTGKATSLFAKHQSEILAIEPGPNLISFAKRNLAKYDKVKFENCRFEDWPIQSSSFDLVISAAAIYWVDPEVRYKKIAEALKPNGYVAIFQNPKSELEEPLEKLIREIYLSHFEPSHNFYPDKPADHFDPDYFGTDMNNSGLFTKAEKSVYPWKKKYTADQYLKLLGTRSGYVVLDPSIKIPLFEDIGKAIEKQGGEIEISYNATLYMAKKV